MKTLDLIFFGLKGKINGPKALKELESLGVITVSYTHLTLPTNSLV